MAKIKGLDIHQAAKRAKASTATDSRVVNRVATVSPVPAQRDFKAINELGYYPNTQARALASGRSRVFGLILSELTNPSFPRDRTVFRDHSGQASLRNSARFRHERFRAGLAEDSQSDHFSWGSTVESMYWTVLHRPVVTDHLGRQLACSWLIHLYAIVSAARTNNAASVAK